MASETIDMCSTVIPHKSGIGVGSGSYRMAMKKEIFWSSKDIRVRFLEGDENIQEAVKESARIWEKYANIKFKFVTGEPSNIRISFDESGGWWSKIGTEAVSVKSPEPTMNLGVTPVRPGADAVTVEAYEDDLRRHVLHEFGHALGCVHEHSSHGAGVIPWDKEKAYEYYEETNGWVEETVDRNVFDLYNEKTITQYSKFDKMSIMVYPISEELLTDEGYSVPWNTKLSEMDKSYIGLIYPFLKEPTRSSGPSLVPSPQAVRGPSVVTSPQAVREPSVVRSPQAVREPSLVRSPQAVRELRSMNGRFLFIMQDDGNVVLYEGQHPKWASNTDGQRGGPFKLSMQEDGNLVAYTASGHPFWATNTHRQPNTGPFTLIMQDDGNCVIYNGMNKPTWATNTCER